MKKKPIKVMFLCTANSCRSQMAEGLMRALSGGNVEVHSAGIIAAGLHPRAVRVMKEAGMDISGQYSKTFSKGFLSEMDFVITLCEGAEEACPAVPPSVRRIHWPIKDPVGKAGTEEKLMEAFRKTRDEIRERVEIFLGEIGIGKK